MSWTERGAELFLGSRAMYLTSERHGTGRKKEIILETEDSEDSIFMRAYPF